MPGLGVQCSLFSAHGRIYQVDFSPISTEPCTPRLKALLRGAVRAHYPEGLMPLEEGRKAETTSENEERRPTDEMCIRREKDSIKKDTIKNFKTHLLLGFGWTESSWAFHPSCSHHPPALPPEFVIPMRLLNQWQRAKVVL